jgi:hypothetical protein
MKVSRFFFRAIFLVLPFSVSAQQNIDFPQWFTGTTLRVDYTFAGDSATQELSLDELLELPTWAGRRHNLDSLCLAGNGQITMRDSATHRVIYRTSFSSLFQEWQTTEEASRLRRSFENVFLLPMPKQTVEISLKLFDTHRHVLSQLHHTVNPKDILIHKIGTEKNIESRYIHRGGNPDTCIDVAIVAEGYTADEMPKFYKRASEATESILGSEPFKSSKNLFNIIAVASPSHDSGISIPGKGIWKQTALNSHFDTFYSDRYLTTLHLKKLHDILASIPYEHIVILANTENYGGGGILNSYTLTAADHEMFKPVVIHEFGHSFGGLADEYFYDDQYSTMYPSDTEPWEQNITTLVDFESKWKDILPESTKIPTPPTNKGNDIYTKIGVYEGGGYQSKGVYRAFQECRMKINEAPEFCKVCRRALQRVIDFYTH